MSETSPKPNFAREAEIRAAVVKAFGVKWEEIEGPARWKYIMRARHSYCWLLKQMTQQSPFWIGRMVNRDRTTVMYAIDNVSREMTNYQPELSKAIAFVRVQMMARKKMVKRASRTARQGPSQGVAA
jgi:chromosomal replication initiation ATPase DnaA